MGLMPDANGPLIPGGSAVTGQSPAAPSRASSLSILSGQQSNLQLKGMLGSNVFSELRSAILAQQASPSALVTPCHDSPCLRWEL